MATSTRGTRPHSEAHSRRAFLRSTTVVSAFGLAGAAHVVAASRPPLSEEALELARYWEGLKPNIRRSYSYLLRCSAGVPSHEAKKGVRS